VSPFAPAHVSSRLPHNPRSSLRNELLEQGSLKEADASALVEEVLQDTDLAKYFDEEFEVSASH